MATVNSSRRKAKMSPGASRRSESSATPAGAQSAWAILDDSDIQMRRAKALLVTIRIALLSPDHQLDDGLVVDSLVVLADLLDEVRGGIDRARYAVRPPEATEMAA